MFYDPRSEPHGLAHTPINALVVPRPIGWITTLTPAGTVNLAPYSFFNLVSSGPPIVMFSSGPRKDSQSNAEDGRRVRLQHGDLRAARGDERIVGGVRPGGERAGEARPRDDCRRAP